MDKPNYIDELKQCKIWNQPIRVAGITFRVKHMDEITVDCTDVVEIEREPDNQYDKYAIKVSIIKDDGARFHFGYVPSKIAARIKDEELPSVGTIVWRSGDPEKPGVRIAI